MKLTDKLSCEGNFLFAYRSYLPLMIVPFAILVLISADSPLYAPFMGVCVGGGGIYNLPLIVIALIIGILGETIRILVAGYAPQGTSGRNTHTQIASTLNTSGLYSMCRNPLYLGNFLMMLSPVILLGNWLFIAIFILAFWLYYERIISAEEAFLSRKFGESYQEWCAQTPCFIPSFKHFRKPSLPFSVRSMLKREYHSIFALASSLLAMNLIIVAIDIVIELGRDMPRPSAILLVAFGISLVIYLICLILSKKTRILHAQGR